MNILSDFQILGGVRHSCLIHKHRLRASNFPAMFNDNLLNTARIFKQMLDALQALQQGHNEVQIEMNDSRLLGFQLNEDTLFVLMTEPNINQALIGTAIRSAAKNLIAFAQSDDGNIKPASAMQPSVTMTKHIERTDRNVTHGTDESETLKPTLKQIIRLLSEQVGPAAQILFKREYVIWTNEGEVSTYRLPLLTSRIASFIEHPEKRSHFLLGASDLINAATTTESSNAIH